MKIKAVPTIIAAAICALLAFGFYSWSSSEGHRLLLAIGGFISLFLPLATFLGVRFEGRTTATTIAVGATTFAVMLVVNILFSLSDFSVPAFVIVNGILLLVMVGIVYALAKAKQ